MIMVLEYFIEIHLRKGAKDGARTALGWSAGGSHGSA